MGQPVCAARARPVIRNKDGVGPDGLHHHGSKRRSIAPRCHRHPVSVMNAVLLRQARMNLHSRFGILIH